MAIQKLLFVDTNIWLDFYRARTDAGLSLLDHLEAISDQIIVTYQLEMEFKKNRQHAILEGMQELKIPQSVSRPALLSDAKSVKVLQVNHKNTEKQIKKIKERLGKALANPATNDPVYKVCQRIFHRQSDLVLSREDKVRYKIRRQAFKRFIHGCPPRKKNDTSIGDAINWEWMINCATSKTAELVIISRDSDYGTIFDNQGFINDHLKQEFSERVSRKRKVLLYSKLSEALKHFKIPITPQEEQEEEFLAKNYLEQIAGLHDLSKANKLFMRLINKEHGEGDVTSD